MIDSFVEAQPMSREELQEAAKTDKTIGCFAIYVKTFSDDIHREGWFWWLRRRLNNDMLMVQYVFEAPQIVNLWLDDECIVLAEDLNIGGRVNKGRLKDNVMVFQQPSEERTVITLFMKYKKGMFDSGLPHVVGDVR